MPLSFIPRFAPRFATAYAKVAAESLRSQCRPKSHVPLVARFTVHEAFLTLEEQSSIPYSRFQAPVGWRTLADAMLGMEQLWLRNQKSGLKKIIQHLPALHGMV
jgi:hypothetical protein